jgi:hypothetical protein
MGSTHHTSPGGYNPTHNDYNLKHGTIIRDRSEEIRERRIKKVEYEENN